VSPVQALQQRSVADQAAGDTKATSQLTSVQSELERTSGQLKAVTAEVEQLKQQNQVRHLFHDWSVGSRYCVSM